ncbi:MAG TPA: nucleotide sugar dehydrogenase [Myxococcota bacterium]|nr:nucleotide sugar dehydrogenase [Myxococcota bacterium]HPB50026.1 nucleotide sugar dehydrogenase [Myxococcota bacterium]HQP94602.1 nucleotide sugar dehydrogenase [Myxococcota bacterium]
MGLVERIESGKAVVGIIGLGYVGLPLAEVFCRKGFNVLGFDTDAAKVEKLASGRTYIRHIPDEVIARLVAGGFEPVTDFARVSSCDAILVCVPTPLNQNLEPDMSFVVGSCRQMGPHIRQDQLIVLESTTYPGTTVEVMKPVLEESSGLVADRDFWLAFSPEREDPNNPEFECETIPKIVGADCEYARRAAEALYGSVMRRIVPVSSTRVAEAAKILENTFRAVNIALVNELKVVFDRMGIDVWEVIDAAATKPFGFMKFTPGPGIGGHCIPIDPFYLVWKAREYEVYSRFIETAGQVNRSMPAYVVSRTMEAFSRMGRGLAGARILIIGLAYKKNMDDARESPSYRLMDLFEQQGALVSYHDPHIPVIPPSREYSRFMGRESVGLDRAGDFDAVVISTEHDAVDWEGLLQTARLIVDTRGVYRQPHPRVIRA